MEEGGRSVQCIEGIGALRCTDDVGLACRGNETRGELPRQQHKRTKCRLRGQVEMAREIDANLSRALKRDVCVGSAPRVSGAGAGRAGINVSGRDSDSDVDFDRDDLKALSAFSSLFGGLPAVRLGLVDISAARSAKSKK